MVSPLPPTIDEQLPVCFLLDKDGHSVRPAINYFEWRDWMETSPDRRVAKTMIDGYRISTIFWGIAEYGPNKHFETMLLEGDSSSDLAAWRCGTRAEAEEQHERACAWVRAQLASGALPPLPQNESEPNDTQAARFLHVPEFTLTGWDITKFLLLALFLPRWR